LILSIIGLGAHHIINYEYIHEWGLVAKDPTLGGTGADYLIDIGGPMNLIELIIAAAIHGIIAVVETRGGEEKKGAKMRETQLHIQPWPILDASRLKIHYTLEEKIKAI
jgi:dihydrodipicolinate reductase